MLLVCKTRVIMTSERLFVWMYFPDHICRHPGSRGYRWLGTQIVIPPTNICSGLMSGHSTSLPNTGSSPLWNVDTRYKIPACVLTQDNQSNNAEQCLHSCMAPVQCATRKKLENWTKDIPELVWTSVMIPHTFYQVNSNFLWGVKISSQCLFCIWLAALRVNILWLN